MKLFRRDIIILPCLSNSQGRHSNIRDRRHDEAPRVSAENDKQRGGEHKGEVQTAADSRRELQREIRRRAGLQKRGQEGPRRRGPVRRHQREPHRTRTRNQLHRVPQPRSDDPNQWRIESEQLLVVAIGLHRTLL